MTERSEEDPVPLKFTILTLFPDMVRPYLDDSILGRARERGIVSIEAVDLRDWADDKHRTADDSPYGGGGGMLLKAAPAAAALDAVAGPPGSEGRAHVVYTSPLGRTWDQQRAREIAGLGRDVVILCGRYEGLDQRVIDTRVDEEVSLGDFILTGGEIAALAMVDSVVRLLPGALGNEASAPNDSFFDGLLEAPHYTRPEEFEGLSVPEVLISGHHAAIEQWRRETALRITRERRPDLYAKWYEDHREELEAAEARLRKRRRRKQRPPSDEAEPPTNQG